MRFHPPDYYCAYVKGSFALAPDPNHQKYTKLLSAAAAILKRCVINSQLERSFGAILMDVGAKPRIINYKYPLETLSQKRHIQ